MLCYSGDIYYEVNEKVGRNGDFYLFVFIFILLYNYYLICCFRC